MRFFILLQNSCLFASGHPNTVTISMVKILEKIPRNKLEKINLLLQISIRCSGEDCDVLLVQCHGVFQNWRDDEYSQAFKTTRSAWTTSKRLVTTIKIIGIDIKLTRPFCSRQILNSFVYLKYVFRESLGYAWSTRQCFYETRRFPWIYELSKTVCGWKECKFFVVTSGQAN